LAKGTVLTIDNAIDTTTGTVRVRSSFANRDFRLFPNEFVNTRLLLKTLRKANLIPTAAIQRNNEIAFVYVVDENNAVKMRDIKIGTTDGNTAAVTGVNAGEKLVTDGFDRLQDGVKVVVRNSGDENPQSPAVPQNQAGPDGAPNRRGPSNNATQGQGVAPRANSR
jgi:multidrug efflux system membrane fusion protein